MSKIDFAITVNVSLALQKDSATVSVKNVELKPAMISLPIRLLVENRSSEKEKVGKKTIHDIVLETAQRYVSEKGVDRFRAAQLFHFAKESYPNLKRNSFGAHVIAAAPNHNSWKHYPNRKDYLFYLGKGVYRLK